MEDHNCGVGEGITVGRLARLGSSRVGLVRLRGPGRAGRRGPGPSGVEDAQRVVVAAVGAQPEHLHVEYPGAGVGEPGDGLAHHGCVAEHGVRWFVGGRPDADPDRVDSARRGLSGAGCLPVTLGACPRV